jgi:hypothetical protein
VANVAQPSPGLAPAQCSLQVLENSHHRITADHDRQPVADTLFESVRRVAGVATGVERTLGPSRVQ